MHKIILKRQLQCYYKAEEAVMHAKKRTQPTLNQTVQYQFKIKQKNVQLIHFTQKYQIKMQNKLPSWPVTAPFHNIIPFNLS
jgi:hypothetical protein